MIEPDHHSRLCRCGGRLHLLQQPDRLDPSRIRPGGTIHRAEPAEYVSYQPEGVVGRILAGAAARPNHHPRFEPHS